MNLTFTIFDEHSHSQMGLSSRATVPNPGRERNSLGEEGENEKWEKERWRGGSQN